VHVRIRFGLRSGPILDETRQPRRDETATSQTNKGRLPVNGADRKDVEEEIEEEIRTPPPIRAPST